MGVGLQKPYKIGQKLQIIALHTHRNELAEIISSRVEWSSYGDNRWWMYTVRVPNGEEFEMGHDFLREVH